MKRKQKSKLLQDIEKLIIAYKIKNIYLSNEEFEKFCKEIFRPGSKNSVFYKNAEIKRLGE